MKLHTNHSVIERSGVKGETAFTIKTNALSFSILSSGLYTDPIMAIVRELSCNAYDSHVAAKKENVPFEIHLPNSLEPFFSVKDYGVGLSDEEIRGVLVPVMIKDKNGNEVQSKDSNGELEFTRSGGLYTTYFDSTKNNSNDFIGALGLGSKSPFSYTDAFEVISRHNGKKRIYAIFLNEEGIPTVALMNEFDTDESNGLEVKISVKKSDFNKFSDKTAAALKYFSVKPKVIGYPNFKFEELPKIYLKTDNWIVAEKELWQSYSFVAVQGNVPYRVDVNQILNHIDDKHLVNFISDVKIVAFFNIGELEVSANREEIRYDNRTISSIVNKLKNIIKEFTEEIDNKLNNMPNKKIWYAFVKINKFSHTLIGNDNIVDYIDKKYIKNPLLKKYIELRGVLPFTYPRGYDVITYVLKPHGNDYRLSRVGKLRSYIKPTEKIVVAINDGKRDALKQLRQYIIDNNLNSAIVLSKRDPIKMVNDLGEPIPYEGHDKEIKKIIKMFGDVEFIKISALNYVFKKQKSNKNKSKIWKYRGVKYGYYNTKTRFLWEESNYILNSGGIYVPIKFGSSVCIVNKNDKYENISIHNYDAFDNCLRIAVGIFNNEHKTTFTVRDIYGIPSKEYKNVKDNSKWFNMLDYVKIALELYKDNIEFLCKLRNSYDFLGIQKIINNEKFIKYLNELDDDSNFKQSVLPVVETMLTMNDRIINNANNLLHFYKLFLEKDIDRTPFWSENEFNKYPMLTFVGNMYYNTDRIKDIFEYIKLVDRS